MTVTWRSGTYLVGLLTGVLALLAGLLALETQPIVGTLITLAGMALLLAAAAEFCQAHGIHEPDLQEKQ
ncbi:MAG TPA: hypothetical protein VES66_06850 [Terriglobales bacterium]|nr:hypothetical protein [Terriglobales bacterium]